jgi:hypothetical protein
VILRRLCRGVEGDEEPHLSTGEDGNWYAVAINETIAGQCSQARPGGQNFDEIERVRRGERYPLLGDRLTARLPKKTDRFGLGVLFAGEAGDETAAANFSARFKPAAESQQLAPRR